MESQPSFNLCFPDGLLRLDILYMFIAVCISDLFCVQVFVNAAVPEDMFGIQFASCQLTGFYQSVVRPGCKHLHPLSHPTAPGFCFLRTVNFISLLIDQAD